MTRMLLYLVALLLGTFASGKSPKFDSYLTRNIAAQQWKYFERVAQPWRGLWMRVNSTGNVFVSTKMQRNFTKIPGGRDGIAAYLQTNVYQNPNWSASGALRTQWVYLNTTPPTWGRLVLSNGSLSQTPLPGRIAFFPYGFGHFAFAQLTGPDAITIAENFLLHPKFRNVRLSLTPVYYGYNFGYVAVAREVARVKRFPASIWKGGKVVDVVSKTPLYKGTWKEVKYCIYHPSLKYERIIRTVIGVSSLPTGQNFVTLRLRDGPIYSVCPLELGKPAGLFGRTFYVDWIISRRTVLRSVITLKGSSKEIVSHCVSIFTRIADL